MGCPVSSRLAKDDTRNKKKRTRDRGTKAEGRSAITGDHSKYDLMLLVKVGKYIGFVCTIGPINYAPP